MNNDELWELQQSRWQELRAGFVELRLRADDLSTWDASSNVACKLNSIKELAEELQQVADDITATAWRED